MSVMELTVTLPSTSPLIVLFCDGRHLYRFVEQWLWNPGDPRLRQGDHGGQPQWRFEDHWFGVRVGLVALMAGGSAAKGSIPGS